MKYIVANWKSHKTKKEVQSWFDELRKVWVQKVGVETIVAPAFVLLDEVAKAREKIPGIKLATQDISPFPFGAYTGAVSAEMVQETVSYAIVGHSERRRYFGETDQQVANKVSHCLKVGIIPIVCVDEDYIESQMAAIEATKGFVVAYEPLEAIGSGNPQDVDEVTNVALHIKEVTGGLSVLYGGSINENNAAEYLGVDGIDGLLVGGASLDGEKFGMIATTA